MEKIRLVVLLIIMAMALSVLGNLWFDYKKSGNEDVSDEKAEIPDDIEQVSPDVSSLSSDEDVFDEIDKALESLE